MFICPIRTLLGCFRVHSFIDGNWLSLAKPGVLLEYLLECLSHLPSALSSIAVQFVSRSGCTVDSFYKIIEVSTQCTRMCYIWVNWDLWGLSVGVWTCHACYGCHGGKVSSRILWRFYEVFLYPHDCFLSILSSGLLCKGYMFFFVSVKAKYI